MLSIKFHTVIVGIVLGSTFLLGACKRDMQCNVPIGDATGSINLSMPDAYPLWHAGGAVRVHGGYKGIWVVNTGMGYTAFEAACPVDNEVGVVLVDGIDGVLQCPKCKTVFSTYTDGYPIDGSITYCPLFQYSIYREGDILYLSN